VILCNHCKNAAPVNEVSVQAQGDDDLFEQGDLPYGDLALCRSCRESFFRELGSLVRGYHGEWSEDH
jgi:hypothetical protein